MPQDWTLLDGPEIDGRLKAVIARTSQVLSIAEMELVRQGIAKSLDLRRQLRTLPLENQDEPEPAFDPAAGRMSTIEDRSL